MPVHDWSRVGAGIFHDFHGKWISAISTALNEGLLPADYYTITEAHASGVIADILTLEIGDDESSWSESASSQHRGATAVAETRPRVRITETAEEEAILAKQRRVVVRHSSDDHIVALIEIVSPGNKSSREALDLFVRKASHAIRRGWHLLILDLQPPSPRDPQGIHGVLWPEVGGGTSYKAPTDKPLTLAAYEAAFPKNAYVEPIAVGDIHPEMPVFLAPGWYVNLPLEPTYEAAWRGVARRWRDVLEPATGV
jgi:Protein of unknown function (DUF4058)